MAIYTPPTLTIDGVIFQLIDSALSVLLIKRAHDPFQGEWALPGGYNPKGETTYGALGRIVRTKTGVDIKELPVIEQLYTFDTVARDPRGHAVSVAYMGLGKDIQLPSSNTTENPQFYPITALPKLAYDHDEIIRYAHQRLQSKVGYTNIIFALLPAHFTLSQLQTAYEAILCRKLDKRNFRKKFLSLDLVDSIDEYYREGAHRPALLYKFRQETLQTVDHIID